MISNGPPPVNEEDLNTTVNSCNRTDCNGLVWIYYSDAKNLRGWGTIDSNQVTANTVTTICRQLGYSRKVDHSSISAPGHDSHPVWLTDIKCPEGESFSNILQCSHRHCGLRESCHNHTHDLVVKCSEYRVCSPLQRNGLLCPTQQYLQASKGLETTFYISQ